MVEVSFNLEGLDLREWDLLLKAKCKRYNFPWTKPTFKLIANAYMDFNMVREGYCFYGLFFKETKEAVDSDWEKESDPVTLLRIKDEPYEGDISYRLYLGIRASFIQAKQKEGIAELNVSPIQVPTTWRELLKSKYAKYGISRKEPKFCLLVEG